MSEDLVEKLKKIKKLVVEHISTLKGHTGPVFSVFADRYNIYSCSGDRTIRLWDRRTFREITSLSGYPYPVLGIMVDRHHIYTSSGNIFRVWSRETLGEAKRAEEHRKTIFAIHLDYEYVYTGSADKSVIVWDKNNLSRVMTIAGNPYPVYSIASDDKYIYLGLGDKDSDVGIIRVLDRKTFKEVSLFEGHKGPVKSIYVYGPTIFSCSTDQTVRLWSNIDFKLIATLEGHTGPVNSVFADDRYVYSASEDGTIRIWSRENLAVDEIIDAGSPVLSMFVDDCYIFAGLRDHTIKIWLRPITYIGGSIVCSPGISTINHFPAIDNRISVDKFIRFDDLYVELVDGHKYHFSLDKPLFLVNWDKVSGEDPEFQKFLEKFSKYYGE